MLFSIFNNLFLGDDGVILSQGSMGTLIDFATCVTQSISSTGSNERKFQHIFNDLDTTLQNKSEVLFQFFLTFQKRINHFFNFIFF